MESFRHAPFRYVQRVPSSSITHVSASPPCHPGRSDFPSPVGDYGFPLKAFPVLPKLKCRPTYAPCDIGLPSRSTHHGLYQPDGLKVPGCPAKVPAICREPLCPQVGVTPCGVMSCTTSDGITHPSSLIQAHGPDHNPPASFGCPYSVRSS